MIKKIKNFVVDLFFPVYCVSCNKEGSWICESCQKKISRINSSFCAKCNALTVESRLCERCRRNSALSGVFILGYYNDKVLKKAIWDFKYNFISEIGPILSKILAENLITKTTFENTVFISVPLDKKRLKWRSFNQSDILAEELSKNIGTPYLKDALKRVKETKSQMKLSKKERAENVLGAFEARRDIKDKIIFLVDDVITTGSTLEECAKELKKAGAKEVWGVVLAKD